MLKRSRTKWERPLFVADHQTNRFTRFEYAPKPGRRRFSPPPTTVGSSYLRKLSVLKLSKGDRAYRRGSYNRELGIYLNLNGRNQSIRFGLVRVGFVPKWSPILRGAALEYGSASTKPSVNLPHSVHVSTKSVLPSCLLHPIPSVWPESLLLFETKL